MIIWLNLANVMFFPPITDQFLHICALFIKIWSNIVSPFEVAQYKKGLKNYVKPNTLAFKGPFLYNLYVIHLAPQSHYYFWHGFVSWTFNYILALNGNLTIGIVAKQKSPSLNSPSWRLNIIVKSIYTNDFTVIHVTFEKRKRMKTLNCILSAMAIIAC